jgi:hypothetical protein
MEVYFLNVTKSTVFTNKNNIFFMRYHVTAFLSEPNRRPPESKSSLASARHWQAVVNHRQAARKLPY